MALVLSQYIVRCFFTNTIIKKKFLHPKKLSAAASSSDVFSLNNREGER